MATKRKKTKHHKSSQRSHKYNNTSSAYAYDYEQNSPSSSKRILKKKKLKRKSREIIINAMDKSARPSILVYVTIFLIVSSIAVSIMFNSLVTTQGMKNQTLRNELKAMQSKTAELMMISANNMDLSEIERIARTRLEMSEPQTHQIIYIDVPKQSYAVRFQDSSKDENVKAELSIDNLFGLRNLFKKE